MTKKILFLLLANFIISCNSDKPNQDQDYGYDFTYVRNATISLDSTISPFYVQSQYLPSGNKLIASNGPNTLLVIDLETDTIERKITYKNEGVNDIRKSSGNFYFHNKDSILLLGANSKTFFITNDNAEVLESVKLGNIEKETEIFGQPLVMMSSSSALFRDDILTFVTYPTNANDMRQSLQDPVYVELDIKKNKIENGSVKYGFNAAENLIQYPFHINPLLSRNSENDKVLLFRNNNTFLIEKNDSIFEHKDFKSDYFNNYTEMKSYNEMPVFGLESFSNEKLLYNHKSKFTYLFIWHSIDAKNAENGETNTSFSKPFSVIVFDENFNKILEKKFIGDKYNMLSSFISNDYLYLSLNNPENENFDENFFKYELFKLQEK